MTKDELIEQCARRINKLAWNGCNCERCTVMRVEAREVARDIVADALTWVLAALDADAATASECPANDAGGTADARNGAVRNSGTQSGQGPLSGPETGLGVGCRITFKEALRRAREVYAHGPDNLPCPLEPWIRLSLRAYLDSQEAPHA